MYFWGYCTSVILRTRPLKKKIERLSTYCRTYLSGYVHFCWNALKWGCLSFGDFHKSSEELVKLCARYKLETYFLFCFVSFGNIYNLSTKIRLSTLVHILLASRSFCLELTATGHLKCCSYRHLRVCSKNPSLQPSRI